MVAPMAQVIALTMQIPQRLALAEVLRVIVVCTCAFAMILAR